MGRDKVAGNPAELQKKAAEAEAAAKAAKEAEGPKRRLNRIPNKVHTAPPPKVISLDDKGKSGGGKGGGNNSGSGGGGSSSGGSDWTCPACLATVFAHKDKCFKCMTPKPKNATCFAQTATSSSASSSSVARWK